MYFVHLLGNSRCVCTSRSKIFILKYPLGGKLLKSNECGTYFPYLGIMAPWTVKFSENLIACLVSCLAIKSITGLFL